MLQGSWHLIAIGRISIQHSMVGYQALSAFGKENLVAEFQRL
jgi:hypothetical protein